MKPLNPQLAARRKCTIIRGCGAFCPAAYGVACVQDGALIHVETFYGHDGRTERARANSYAKQYVAGVDFGLFSPLYRNPLPVSFNNTANRQAIARLIEESR